MARGSAALALVGAALVCGLASRGVRAQPQIAVADPWFGFLVEGRVLLPDGRPAVGVVIERAEVREYVAESRTTDARGRFRFEAHGLGWGPGSTWRVTLRRAGCPDVTRSITLRQGPIDGRARDEATGLVLRLPRCAIDRRAPARPRH